MFRGRFYHTIDTKGRLSIPSGFRVELDRRSERSPILALHPECLHFYAFEDWHAIEKRLAEISPVDPEAQRYARFLLSSAVDAPIDRQGRISIPQFLREDSKLGREVVIAGVGSRMEIWNAEQFDAELNTTRAHFNELASDVAPKVGSLSGGG